MEKENPTQLYKELEKIDPVMSNKIHPNDYRKIRRSLEIYEQTKIPHSQLIINQIERNKNELPRYNVRVIWLTCDLDVLHKRLDERVDKMIEEGLIDEVKTLWKEYSSFKPLGYITGNCLVDDGSKEIKTTQGIWQSIGLKEFEPLFANKKIDDDMEIDKKLLNECIEKVKINTFHYAKKYFIYNNIDKLNL